MAIFALSDILEGYGTLTNDQEEGLVATGIGSSVLGLSYLSTKYQIDTSDSLFAGSSMAWGAYYGGLLPLALIIDDRLETHGQILFSLASSDIFLAASCIAMKRGYESQNHFSSNHRHYRWNTGFIRNIFVHRPKPTLWGLPLWEVRPWDLSLEINYKGIFIFNCQKSKTKSFPYNWP